MSSFPKIAQPRIGGWYSIGTQVQTRTGQGLNKSRILPSVVICDTRLPALSVQDHRLPDWKVAHIWSKITCIFMYTAFSNCMTQLDMLPSPSMRPEGGKQLVFKAERLQTGFCVGHFSHGIGPNARPSYRLLTTPAPSCPQASPLCLKGR